MDHPGPRTRRIHWLGKQELFDWPVFGWLAARGGVHPVDRSTADIEAYRLATRILEEGDVLLIFPEGTRSPDGSLQEAKDGLATLAMRTNAAIVPIGINGSDKVWPKGSKLPIPIPRRTITVHIGSPFRVADVVPAGADRRAAKSDRHDRDHGPDRGPARTPAPGRLRGRGRGRRGSGENLTPPGSP